MSLIECIDKIIDEKRDKKVSEEDIYFYFVKPVRFIEIANKSLHSNIWYSGEFARDMYELAKKNIGIVKEHNELHRMIHSLSEYVYLMLKYGKCDQELAQVKKDKIIPTYERMDGTQKELINYLFRNQLNELREH